MPTPTYLPSPIDSDRIEIPRAVVDKDYRRTISPGLFEFISTCEKNGVRTEDRYLNAFQPLEQCEALLRSEEHSGAFRTKSAGVIRHASNYVSAHAKGEDRRSVSGVSIEQLGPAVKAVAERHTGETWWARWADLQEGSEEKDLLFFTVIDGHLGAEACDLLEVAANACLAWTIGNDSKALGGDEQAMKEALSDAILTLNQDISAAPLGILHKPATAPTDAQLPGMPSVAQLISGHLEHGGACIATAVVDLKHGKLYVVNAGDCRVIGVWKKEEEDQWFSAVLTEDHNGFNPGEVARIKAEHPNQPDVMIDTGRGFHQLLGLGQVTHCVGDPAINRTEEERKALLKGAMTRSAYRPGFPAVDPPYVSWRPDVVIRDMKNGKTGAELKFIILGSDGVFEKMTSEESALLTIAHAAHPHHDDVPKVKLPKLFDLAPPREPRPFPAEPLPGSREGDMAKGDWVFEDENPAIHLIRNALGNGDRDLLHQMLSLKHGTRMFRDDTTAMVVSFGRD